MSGLGTPVSAASEVPFYDLLLGLLGLAGRVRGALEGEPLAERALLSPEDPALMAALGALTLSRRLETQLIAAAETAPSPASPAVDESPPGELLR